MRFDNNLGKIETIFSNLLRKSNEYAPVGFLKIRKKEFDLINYFFPIPKVEKILEIGVGIPIHASLLSCFANQYLTVDLLRPTTIHNSDWQKIKSIIETSGQGNIFPIAGNAEFLPFSNSSMDIVFSSSVLEHLENLDHSIAEISRVTKQHGLSIHIVGTPLLPIYNLFYYYPYLCL